MTPFAAEAGLKVEIEDDLRERKLAEGNHPDWKSPIERAWDDWTFRPPGCESGLDCQRRVRTCIDRLARENAGRTTALASHGNAIALYLSSFDESFGYVGWKSMRNPDLFAINYSEPDHPKWLREFKIN